jgi:cell division protein FtsB
MSTSPNPHPRDRYIRGLPAGGVLNRRSLPIIVGIGLCLLLLLSQLGENGVLSWLHLRSAEEELRAEVAALAAENQRLQERLHALENDPWALEKLAREKYNMLGEGEEVLMVVSPSPDPE